jgi:hypothetical protein
MGLHIPNLALGSNSASHYYCFGEPALAFGALLGAASRSTWKRGAVLEANFTSIQPQAGSGGARR